MAKSKLIQWLEAAESAVPDLTPWRSNEVDEDALVFAYSRTLGLWVIIGFADCAWTDTRLREWETALPHKSPAELSVWLARAWSEALNRLRSASPVDATERIAALRQALTTIMAASGDLDNALNAMTFIGETAEAAVKRDCELVTVQWAADELGCSGPTLRSALVMAGHERPPIVMGAQRGGHWRIEMGVAIAALEAWRSRPRGQKPRAPKRTGEAMEIKRPTTIMARTLGYCPRQLRLALLKRPGGPPEKCPVRGKVLVTEVEAREAMDAYLARPTVKAAQERAAEKARRPAPKTRLKWMREVAP